MKELFVAVCQNDSSSGFRNTNVSALLVSPSAKDVKAANSAAAKTAILLIKVHLLCVPFLDKAPLAPALRTLYLKIAVAVKGAALQFTNHAIP